MKIDSSVTSETLDGWLKRCPLVAILRGIKPGEALDIGTLLVESGFTIIEVPLNSPEPFASILRLAKHLGDKALVGAGTVTDWEQVTKIADAGGRVIVMPHADERVVEAAKRRNLFVVPGFATPSEGFRMINAGADAIKLFPAEANPPKVLRSLRAVLPKNVPILPVGGITPQNMNDYWIAGADGFGLGSALYKPGMTIDQVAKSAGDFRIALRTLPKRQ
ncbi:MAG TPA: 2-dehydro-3-deoxy-6-phosphogalactonate aldolase [Burkholderiales bacterium]|nr:2-dehydro-3-deoxy-6-phosphogalactonate aldolase [Burkholderiales bacterium]